MARRNSKSVQDLNLEGVRPVEERDPTQPLTERQRRFVTYFVHEQMTQTAAARAAGFAGAGPAAVELMKHPKIIAAIAEERATYAAASGVTKQKVIDGFLESIDMGRMKADPLAMIAGWREVGKMCGFYEPTKKQVEISVNGQVLVQRLNSMTDEELLALADGSILEGELVDE